MQQDTGPAVSTDTDGGSDGVSRASQLLHTSDMEDSVMQVISCTLSTTPLSVHHHSAGGCWVCSHAEFAADVPSYHWEDVSHRISPAWLEWFVTFLFLVTWLTKLNRSYAAHFTPHEAKHVK